MVEEEEEVEKPSFFERLRRKFTRSREEGEEEGEVKERQYERRFLDSRIEKYLDTHFDEYILQYGIVTQQHLSVYERKAEDFKLRAEDLYTFAKDTEAAVIDQERRATAIESAKKIVVEAVTKKESKHTG